jgi:hypothetical protein
MTDGAIATYLAHVEAPDVEEAILLARTQIDDENDATGPAVILSDYMVLAVFNGYLIDLRR